METGNSATSAGAPGLNQRAELLFLTIRQKGFDHGDLFRTGRLQCLHRRLYRLKGAHPTAAAAALHGLHGTADLVEMCLVRLFKGPVQGVQARFLLFGENKVSLVVDGDLSRREEHALEGLTPALSAHPLTAHPLTTLSLGEAWEGNEEGSNCKCDDVHFPKHGASVDNP
jgi:hypothetical protein